MKADRTLLILGVVMLAVVGAGPLLPQWALFLATIAIAKGLVALGLLLQLRAGLVSFGQALYYCLGAYTAGSLGRFFGIGDMLLQMLAGALVAAFIAFVLGLSAGALSRHFLRPAEPGAVDDPLRPAGQERGAGLDRRHQHPALDACSASGPSQDSVRYVVLVAGCAVAFLATLLVNRYLDTPLGQLAAAIKDNEIRVEYMGASVREAIHAKYVIAAALSGIGGALAATTVGHIDPDMAYWTTSGEFIFITILAGTRQRGRALPRRRDLRHHPHGRVRHFAQHLADDPRHRAACW